MKKAWAMLVAVIMLMNFAGLAVFAANTSGVKMQLDSGKTGDNPLTVNQDGKNKSIRFTVSNNGSDTVEITTPDYCSFDTTYYFAMDPDEIQQGYLSNSNYFRVTISDKKNTNLLAENPTITSKYINGTRYDVVKVKIKESSSTEDKEIRFQMTLKARKDAPSGINGSWSDNDEYKVRFRIWASNKIDDSGDSDIDAGDNVVFKPVVNDDNTITWGTEAYPVATLEFEASSDADDFYAKLSTKVNSRIYDKYGDPADAELFFRTFSGDTIDATSRGTLTLYNPWYDDNYRYSPDPRDIWIYRVNGNSLEDITNKFTYVDEDDTVEGVDGWQIRTRVLDAYVISDKELDDTYWDDDGRIDGELPPDNNGSGGNTAKPLDPNGNNGTQGVPSTGSYNFVPFALIAGAISLTAVGLTRKKKKKEQ